MAENNHLKNDLLKKDSSKNDLLKNDSVKNDLIKKDSVKNDSLKTDSMKNNLFQVIFCAALSILSALVFGLFFRQYFISNDDITLLSIMSGSYTGAPEAHLIYVMYPLGLLFQLLYTNLPKVHWYEGFTVLMHVLVVFFTTLRFSQILGLKNAAGREADSLHPENTSNDIPNSTKEFAASKYKGMFFAEIGVIMFFLLVFGLDLKFYIENQYTVLAGLLSAGAVFQLSVLHLAKSRKEGICSILVTVFFFSVSFLLRKEACLMSIPLYLLAGIYSSGCSLLRRNLPGRNDSEQENSKQNATKQDSPRTNTPDSDSSRQNSKQENKKGNLVLYLAVFTVMILLAGLFLLADRAAYGSEEWKAYRAYNKARTDVFDYNLLPEYAENQAFFNEMGIDEAGYTALKEYNLVLVNDLTTEKLNRIANRQREVLKDWAQYYSVPKKAMKDTFQALLENAKGFTGMVTLLLLLITFLSVTILAKGGSKGISATAFSFALIYFVAFTGLFTYLGRLPDRVYYVLDLITAFFLLGILLSVYFLISNSSEKKKSMDFIPGSVFAVLSVLIFISAISGVNKNQETLSENDGQMKQMVSYVQYHPGQIYFVSSGVYASAVKSMGAEYYEEPVNLVKMVDWAYQSPLMVQKYRSLGISNHPSAPAGENVFFIVKEGMTDTDWISETVKGGSESNYSVNVVDYMGPGLVLKIEDDTKIGK